MDVDYERFNTIELSRYYFDKEYFTHRDLSTATIERFYVRLGEVWDDYYRDVVSYVNGLKTVGNIKDVPSEVEIVAFPYNGFWLL